MTETTQNDRSKIDHNLNGDMPNDERPAQRTLYFLILKGVGPLVFPRRPIEDGECDFPLDRPKGRRKFRPAAVAGFWNKS